MEFYFELGIYALVIAGLLALSIWAIIAKRTRFLIAAGFALGFILQHLLFVGL
jgi:hypothetical protein